MSDKAAMDRQLAEKKQKLEELRRAKAARQQQQQSIDETHSGKFSAAAINMTTLAAAPVTAKQTAEDILNSVSSLIPTPAVTAAAPSSGGAPAGGANAAGSPNTARRALGKSNAIHTDILPGDAKILYEQ